MEKTLSIKLRVSPAERDSIRQRARATGKSVSEFLRLAAQNLYIHAPIPQEVTRSISRWSANLNQLAHMANAGDGIEIEAIRELKQEAVRILQAIEARR